MFEVGKSYKVRTWRSMANEYRIDSDGDIVSFEMAFVTDMEYLCGTQIEAYDFFCDDTIRYGGWLLYYKAFEFMGGERQEV